MGFGCQHLGPGPYTAPMLLTRALAQTRHWRTVRFDARITHRLLKRSLSSALPGLDGAGRRSLLERVRTRTDQLVDDDRSWTIDVPSRPQLEWAASVLAAAECLEEAGLTPGRTGELLAEGTVRMLATPLRRWFVRRLPGVLLGNPGQVQRAMIAFLAQYGAPWHWRGDPRPDGGLDVVTNDCFYHGFMAAHGRPELARVFCAIDGLWQDPLRNGRSGLRLLDSETTTLASGGTACRFPLVPLQVSAARSR